MPDNQRKPHGKPTRITSEIGAYIVKLREEEDLPNLQIANRVKTEYDGIRFHPNVIGRYLKEKNKPRKSNKRLRIPSKPDPSLRPFLKKLYGPQGEKPSIREAKRLFQKTGKTATDKQFRSEVKNLGVEITRRTGPKLGQKNKERKITKKISAAIVILRSNGWSGRHIAKKIEKIHNVKLHIPEVLLEAKQAADAISKHIAIQRKIASILLRHRRINTLGN